jgi:ABC-type phosphate transport system substrate-binding protein
MFPAFTASAGTVQTFRSETMRFIKTVAFGFAVLCVQASIASADEQSSPGTTATRPAREHPEQTSVPNNAPAATTTQTTGSTSQDPTIKKMNEEAKKKLEIEGK